MTALSMLTSGTRAPDFRLRATPDQWVELADFRGAPLILSFYPADWSPVCGDQMALYNECLQLFRGHGAQIVGVSVDGTWSHAAFSSARNLHFPLLADFEPKGAIAAAYGCYHATEGTAGRALFVIDADGIIQWSHISPDGVNPGADGILDALNAFKTGGAS